MWSKSKLRDFFKNYDPCNPNHVDAVDMLQASAKVWMSDDAAWVKKFRDEVVSGSLSNALQKATRIIAHFEGFRSKPYLCPAGVWTIGYGTTFYPNGYAVNFDDDPITETQATEYMVSALERAFVPHLERIPTWKVLNDNQKAAIASFAYNLGPHFYGDETNFATITKALSDKDTLKNVPKALSLYINPGSKFEAGLRKRRQAESELWNGIGEFSK